MQGTYILPRGKYTALSNKACGKSFRYSAPEKKMMRVSYCACIGMISDNLPIFNWRCTSCTVGFNGERQHDRIRCFSQQMFTPCVAFIIYLFDCVLITWWWLPGGGKMYHGYFLFFSAPEVRAEDKLWLAAEIPVTHCSSPAEPAI